MHTEVRTPEKFCFWIGFGWETQNPKKNPKIQTQKNSKNPKNPKPKPKKNPNPIFFLVF